MDWLRSTVKGAITLPLLQRKMPRLGRFLCDPPRRRQRQMAQRPHFAFSPT
ncbi:hypothetical protein HS125_20235 [bacterium]|nr:hypothetical protein [bacterium]MBE7561148.1 hypothetical protein [bacterium]